MLFTSLGHNSQSITQSYQPKSSKDANSYAGCSWSLNGT